MILKTVKSKGLAHNSYFLSDGKEALVVDPRRDCSIYARLARETCTKIRYIFETHRNEDYVIGSLELQGMTDAEIVHSKELPFKYGDQRLDNGETLIVGSLKIKALHTLGHTNESMCFVVFDANSVNEPVMAFTGDTLFVGDVDRTDLLGLANQRAQCEKLHNSLHDKVLSLGDHVIFYPAHGSGSVCGHMISEREYSTIGYELRTNPLLRMDKESFTQYLMNQKLLTPPYFRKMEVYNLDGPPLLSGVSGRQHLDVDEFEDEMQRSRELAVVDTRQPDCFAGSHIPGSLNIWLEGVSVFPGWY
jgi:hydroxyacylglutathione hydrolase